MKRCPFCAEEILDAAIVCRFCQRPLAATAPTQTTDSAEIRRRNQARNSRWLAFAFMAALSGFALLAIAGRGLSEGEYAGARADATPVLELRSALMRQSSSSYMRVEGEVVNVSGESLHYVAAVIVWRDATGKFITSDKAVIEYNPILPGQVSPFKVLSTRNPEMSRFDISFRTLSGPDLPTRDVRGYR